MAPRKYALIAGLIMLVMGVLALIPNLAGTTEGLPVLKLEMSYGAFLGLFAMNIVNKLALIAFGAWGIAASRSSSIMTSIKWSRAVFIVMGLGAVLGLFPATNTFYGYWPLFGAEVGLHALFSLLGAYFGYAYSSRLVRHEPVAG